MRATQLKQTTDVLKAIAEPTRLRILLMLQQGEWCVCELAYVLEVPQSTLSTHLQLLRQVGLVTTRRHGKWIYYRLSAEAAPFVSTLLASMRARLADDLRVARDIARMQQCLQMRVNGCCIMGFRFAPIPNEGGDGACGPSSYCS